MNIENRFKMLEGRIDIIQKLSSECIELIYNAGYNEAIEEAAQAIHHESDGMLHSEIIRKLKK